MLMRKASVLIDQSLKDVRLGSPHHLGIIVSCGEGSLGSCWALASIERHVLGLRFKLVPPKTFCTSKPDEAVPVVQLSTGQKFYTF